MKNIIFFVVLLFVSPLVFSQGEEFQATGLLQTGKLVTIELQPDKKYLKLKFMGRKMADVHLKNLVMEVRFGEGRNKKSLPINLIDNMFVISKEKLPTKNLLIHVKGPKESEAFRFFLR